MTSSNLIIFKEALSETPVPKAKLLAAIPQGESTPFVVMLVDLLCRLDKKVDTLSKTRELGNWVSRKSLRTALLQRDIYMLGFTLGEDDKIYYQNKLLDPNASFLISLCQRIEDDIFKNKEISVQTMITAMKAALIAKRDKEVSVIAPQLTLTVFTEYITSSGVRKKRKMPLKAMCDEFFQYSRQNVIKAINQSEYLTLIPNKNNNGVYIEMSKAPSTLD